MMGRGPQWARCFQKDGYRTVVFGDVAAQLVLSHAFRPGAIRQTVRETLAHIDQAYGFPILPYARFRTSRYLSALLYEHIGLPLFLHGRSDPDTIVWIFRPTRTFDFHRYPHKLLVLDVADDSAGLIPDEQEKQELWGVEKRQARQVDIVLTSAQALYERFKPVNERTYLVRNGVDTELFRSEAALAAVPPPVAQLIETCSGHRVVGYHGAINERLDFQLLAQLAGLIPDWRLVFVGPITPSVASTFQRTVLSQPNAHYWGVLPHRWLPFCVQRFDVGLIPFLATVLTQAINPLKLYEYLAMGKPVVSTPLPEVECYADPDVVHIGCDARDFADVIMSYATRGIDPQGLIKRRQVAEANSWDARYQEMKRILSVSG